jgi:integrase
MLEQKGMSEKKRQREKKRKRGQNEGSIYKRKDGRWVAVLNLGYLNGKLKRKHFYGETREAVGKRLAKATADHQQGLLPPSNERLTVGAFLDQWLIDTVQQTVRPKTAASYAHLIKTHIAPAIGYIRLSKLSPELVQRFLNGQLASGAIRKKDTDPIRGLSPRTVQYLRAILRRALGQALKWGLVARNVATLVDPPRTVKPDINPLSAEETQRFLAACKGDRLESLFLLATALGLRQGEALGLKWEDVDHEAGVLHVRRSMQRVNGKLVLDELKTRNSRRDLPLIETVATSLRGHRSRQLQEKLAAGSEWKENGLVFASSIGTGLDSRNVLRRFHAILKQAGIPRRRFHDLRHGCASILLLQGVPLKTVSDILGHSQIRITADIYAHIVPEMRREALGVMDSVLAAGK